jgi:hypothetical protein
MFQILHSIMDSIRQDNEKMSLLQDLKRLTISDCNICKGSFNHITSNFIFLSCSHSLRGTCFSNLMKHSTKPNKDIVWNCPVCRTDCITFTRFYPHNFRPVIYYTFKFSHPIEEILECKDDETYIPPASFVTPKRRRNHNTRNSQVITINN